MDRVKFFENGRLVKMVKVARNRYKWLSNKQNRLLLSGGNFFSYLLPQWSLKFPTHRRIELSLAAYNAEEQKIEAYGGIPPFKETEDFVPDVLNRFKFLETRQAI